MCQPWLWLTAIAVVFSSQRITGDGLICFSCSYTYTGTETDSECITDPYHVRTGNADLRCQEGEVCVTNRVDDDAFGLLSLSRSCARADPSQDGCQDYQGGTRRSCTRQCDTNLCNSGFGLPESGESDGGVEEEESEYPDGFFPPPVKQDGWYEVWVSSDGTLTLGSVLNLCLAMLVGLFVRMQ